MGTWQVITDAAGNVVKIEEPMGCLSLLGAAAVGIGFCGCCAFVGATAAKQQVQENVEMVRGFLDRNGIDDGAPAVVVGLGVCCLVAVAVVVAVTVLLVRSAGRKRPS